MTLVNVHEAKTQLSKLLERVEAGEDIVIARNGAPVARLVAIRAVAERRPGSAKGQVTLTDAFFEPLPDDMLDAFGP